MVLNKECETPLKYHVKIVFFYQKDTNVRLWGVIDVLWQVGKLECIVMFLSLQDWEEVLHA